MFLTISTGALICIGIIIAIIGGVLIAAYWRDAVTKEVEGDIAEDELRNEAIDAILNDPTLTPEQKLAALLKLLDEGTDWGKIILPATLIIGVAMVLSSNASKR